jgi:hypothetical protein
MNIEHCEPYCGTQEYRTNLPGASDSGSENQVTSWAPPPGGSACKVGSLAGGAADRGAVLVDQVRHGVGVRRGPACHGGFVAAQPAPPHRCGDRGHRVDADHLGDGETDSHGHGAGFLP